MDAAKGKRHLRVVQTTEGFKLGMYARLHYSYLIRCTGRTARSGRVEASLGLHRETVARSRDALVAAGLAVVTRGGVRALPPEGDLAGWFRWFGKDPDWHRDFKYLKMPVPRGGADLGLADALVYALICYQGRETGRSRGMSYTYVGRLLDLDERTAKRCLRRLERLKLIGPARTSDHSRLSWRLLDPTPALDLFLDRGQSRKPKPPATKAPRADGPTRPTDANRGMAPPESPGPGNLGSRPARNQTDRPVAGPHLAPGVEDAGSAWNPEDDDRLEFEELRGCLHGLGYGDHAFAMLRAQIEAEPRFPRVATLARMARSAGGDKGLFLLDLRQRMTARGLLAKKAGASLP